MNDEDVFLGFEPVSCSPQEGFFFDFLGQKTRTSYFHESLQWLSGKVFGLPQRNNLIFFEFEEWHGVMAALKEARSKFTCIELGCGWGPWLVTTRLAATRLGISDVDLIGVEAGATEIENLQTHFRDNGLEASRHKIVNAAVDDRDAPAAPENPGGAALISLETLLAPYDAVDLIHCDIQFAESRAFRAGIGSVTRCVRRVVVGTHSRKIEDELIEIFVEADWALECETPCRYNVVDGRAYLLADGAQVWRNDRLRSSPSPAA